MESTIKALIRKLVPVAALLVAVYGIAAFFFPEKLGTERYVDFSRPTATITQRTDTLFISATDELAGIAKMKLELLQNNTLVTEKMLLTEYRDRDTEFFNIPFISFGREAKEGPATIRITATDDSIFGNSVVTTSDVVFDFTPPQVTLRSAQHRMFAGGTELIIFEALDNNGLETMYIDLQDERRFYPIRLADTDERFQDQPNLYAVLFAVERGFYEKDFKPQLTVVDILGNKVSIPLRIRFVEKPLVEKRPQLSENFLDTVIPPLIEEMRIRGLFAQNDKFFPEESFVQVNETYRRDLGLRLKKALEVPEVTPVIPEGPFVRPMAGRLTSQFGEHRKYMFKARLISESKHEGQDIASIKRDTVVATAAGKVVMAEPFGIYGNTVVIDHGLGVSSLYGHLSFMSVDQGQQVAKGEKIGNSGESGLAGGDHLHFEIRVQNVPVTPIEWWDEKWYNDNIRLKLEDPELLGAQQE